jgi:drug/metabolite transporter (DMT)-like permease
MVAWAFYTILVAQVSKYVSAYSAVAWAGLLGSLTTAAYSILTGQFALPYDLSALAWGSYFYVIFIGSLVGMLFWNKGIRVIGPSQAAVFMNLMPLVGIICGIAFLDESFYTSEAVGGALIIAGVYLTTQYRLLAYKLARYLVKRRRQKSLNDC